MRVIGGSAKGTNLFSPTDSSTRPTTDRAKQKLFDTINTVVFQPNLALDLFSGSGALGIEALSRGISSVIFVENSIRAVKILQKNLQKTHLSQRAQIFVEDAFLYLDKKLDQIPDLIIADPPYNQGLTQKLLDLISTKELFAKDGLLVLEDLSQTEFQIPANFYLYKTKISGYTSHYFFRYLNED